MIDLWTLTGACVGYAIAPLVVVVLDAMFSGFEPGNRKANEITKPDDWVFRRWERKP